MVIKYPYLKNDHKFIVKGFVNGTSHCWNTKHFLNSLCTFLSKLQMCSMLKRQIIEIRYTCLKNDCKFIVRGFISANTWWTIYKSSYKLLKHTIYVDVPYYSTVQYQQREIMVINYPYLKNDRKLIVRSFSNGTLHCWNTKRCKIKSGMYNLVVNHGL